MKKHKINQQDSTKHHFMSSALGLLFAAASAGGAVAQSASSISLAAPVPTGKTNEKPLRLAEATATTAPGSVPVSHSSPPKVDLHAPTLTQASTSEQPCARLDTLRYPGRENNVFPSACDTLDANAQWRQTLFDHGFLTSVQIANRYSYDLLGHNVQHQVYNGQNPTENTGFFLEVVYDLSRLGLPDGSRFAFGPMLQRGNFSGAGPNAGGFNELSAFIPLFNRRVEFQIGYEEWQNVFYGSNLGTSSASSALGPQSSLQTELGMATFIASPGFDIRFWDSSHHFYDHFGMSRSAAPNGGYAYDTARGPGVEWVVPGTGALFINEIGYRIPRGPDTHYLWLRAGAIYNNTEFSNFNHDGQNRRGNQGFYITGDYQITKPSQQQYYRGLYVNFKLDAAPPDRNLYADDASLSLYDIGPFAGRPHDSASIGVTYNHFSPNGVAYFTEKTGTKTPSFSTTLIGSYNIHVHRGIFLVNALSWVRHPSATKMLPDALVYTNSLNILF